MEDPKIEDQAVSQDPSSTEHNPFDAVRDKIKFEGFTKAQQEEILDQYEEAYNAPGGTTGRDMIDAGLALPNGLTVKNSNNQKVMEDAAREVTQDHFAKEQALNPNRIITEAEKKNFEDRVFDGGFSEDFVAIKGKGEVHVGDYPSISDPTTNTPDIINRPGSEHHGKPAVPDDRPLMIDKNGVVYEAPAGNTLLHETAHAVKGDPDLTENPTHMAPRAERGIYYSEVPSGNVPDDYRGPNETFVQKIQTEMGQPHMRGSYFSAAPNSAKVGDDYGLGREHDVAVAVEGIDMRGHAPVDAVIVSARLTDLQKEHPTANYQIRDVGKDFFLSDGNETVHAFDGIDIIHTGDGDDRIFAGEGKDFIYAGWGSKTLDGGDANLDPNSDHKSDPTKDWGVDTVDYRGLSAGSGFGTTGADGINRSGILMKIDGNDITVTKGKHTATASTEDVDILHNVDIMRGSKRDDLAEVDEVTGHRLVDGGLGDDTLKVPDNVTNNPGAGLFNGQPYDGYFEAADGSRLYYKDFEKIEQLKPEAEPVKEASTDSEIQLEMKNALEIMERQSAAVEMEDSAVGASLRSGAAGAIISTLAHHGETDLVVSEARMNGGPSEQVGEILRASTERLETSGLTEEATQTFLQQQAQKSAAAQLTDLENQAECCEAAA